MPQSPQDRSPSAVHIRARDARGQVADVARLHRGSITVGSAPHNALVLPGRDVAPVQLRVDWDGISSGVTLTNIGDEPCSVGNLRLTPHASLTWDSRQLVRVGSYSLKLVGLPTPDDAAAIQPITAVTAGAPRLGWRIVATGALALLALGVLTYSLLARPAQIMTFTIHDSGDERRVQFAIDGASRVMLLVDGKPADPARLAYDSAAGRGSYLASATEQDFALSAYNVLNQPTVSRLELALATATPVPTPAPSATPLPGDPFVAEFSFNGLDKANELSDLLLNKGDGLVIAWDVANVTGVELQPAGTFKANDSVRVAPQDTTVYTLVARNVFGEAKRSVKVVVLDARSTESALGTASAGAQATRDAIAAEAAQRGATATAGARATATSIALVLAEAQARATEAAAAGAATAQAQSTALAAGTLQAEATRQVQSAISATATAIVQATANADTTRFSRYDGIWLNDNPRSAGVVRLAISNVGASITVRSFANCAPQPELCDWGSHTQAYTDEPFLVRYDFGDGASRTLLLVRDGARLRVEDVDSRGPVRTEIFSPSPTGAP